MAYALNNKLKEALLLPFLGPLGRGKRREREDQRADWTDLVI